MRTKPPHSSAVRAAVSSQPDSTSPAAKGSTSPRATQPKNQRSTNRIAGSFNRSGAKRRTSVRRLRSNSQPVCECQRPLSTPRQPSASCVWGLCGSPSSSANVWCLRWSATQWIDRALDRHRAERRERPAHRRRRLEGAVGEQAVEADGDAEADEQVHDAEDRQVAAADESAPGEDDRGDEGDERHDDYPDGDSALERAHGQSHYEQSAAIRTRETQNLSPCSCHLSEYAAPRALAPAARGGRGGRTAGAARAARRDPRGDRRRGPRIRAPASRAPSAAASAWAWRRRCATSPT